MAAIELASTPLFSDSNLQAYWKLENVNDSGPNAYTLTNVNSVAFNAGKFNNGGDSGASNSTKLLNVASNVGIDGGAVTMNLWFNSYATTFTGDHPALFCTFYYGGKAIDYRIGINTTGIFAARLKSAVAWQETAATAISASTWYMATLTYDTTNLKLYLNGVLKDSIAASGDGIITGGYTTGTSFLSGALDPTRIYTSAIVDDASIFSRALTAQEISNLYSGTWSSGNFFLFL